MKHFTICLLVFFVISFSLSGESDRPKIGLCLSGGGARGIAHIGVLKVIEEVGLEFDYITGTSMGSIIGSLYAIGYTPEEMEEIILQQNWDEILLDEISLRSISMEEKQERSKYAGSFPIEKGRITLPAGLVAGQQVHSLLNKLCISVHHIENFENLPIPFLCIGTDIETGEAVVLKEGFLPDAIRASMSIPSVFAPIEIDGQLLVDGGLVRNLPVSDLYEMGADITVGVDVGTPLYSKKDLNSLVRIMNQAISFQGVESTNYERSICDILIEPAIDEYSIMDFEKCRELIRLGEEAGRCILPELYELKDEMDKYPSKPEIIPITSINEVFIKHIHVQGLRNVSKNLVIGKLGFRHDEWVDLEKLNHAIERVYGSQYFEKVTYKLNPASNGVDLFIRVVEKSSNHLHFGFHYDNELDAAVLINATLRNKLIMGSKFDIGAELSSNPIYKASYFVHTGWRPGFGFGLSVRGEQYDVPIYNDDHHKISIYNYDTSASRFDIQTIFSNDFTVGVGLEHRSTDLKPEIIQGNEWDTEIDYKQFVYEAYCLVNTYDREVLPRKGVKMDLIFRQTAELEHSLESEGIKRKPLTTYLFKMSSVDKIVDNLYYDEYLCIGSLKGAVLQDDSFFYLGGLSEPETTIMPFMGYRFMELSAANIFVFSSNLRYEFPSGYFVRFKTNWAWLGDSMKILVESADHYHGYGVSLGLLTPIGPVETALSRANDRDETLFSVNIGYKF